MLFFTARPPGAEGEARGGSQRRTRLGLAGGRRTAQWEMRGTRCRADLGLSGISVPFRLCDLGSLLSFS